MKVLSGVDLKRCNVVWAETPEEDYDGPTTITWRLCMDGGKEREMETPGWISHGRLYAPAGYELGKDVYDAQGLPRTDVDWYDVETGALATVEGGEMRAPMGTPRAMCRQPVWLGGTPRYIVSETLLSRRPDGTYHWTSAFPTGIVAASFEEAKRAYQFYLGWWRLVGYQPASELEGLIHNPRGPAYWVYDPEVSALSPIALYMAVIEEVYGDDPQALRT